MDDREIIKLYLARDEQAIAETDAKYGRLCETIAYNILKNREDSEECVSDTYAGLWEAIPPNNPQNFKAFVCRVARNLSLKRLKYKSRDKRSPDILIPLDELEAVLPDEAIANDIGDDELGRLINRFLRDQSEDVRNVFIRRYFFFDSVNEIAKRFGFGESKVKNILLRSRKKLKDYLIGEGIEI